MSSEHKVSTCLWFDSEAEDAAQFYTSLIPGSRITHVARSDALGASPKGKALMVVFELGGTEYMGLNGGPMFKHSEAASIMVKCDSQKEIDYLWSSLLSDGGTESQCFWLKDRFGMSWQIVPSQIGEWIAGPDKVAAARVMSVVMQSVKADMAKLEAAFLGN